MHEINADVGAIDTPWLTAAPADTCGLGDPRERIPGAGPFQLVDRSHHRSPVLDTRSHGPGALTPQQLRLPPKRRRPATPLRD